MIVLDESETQFRGLNVARGRVNDLEFKLELERDVVDVMVGLAEGNHLWGQHHRHWFCLFLDPEHGLNDDLLQLYSIRGELGHRQKNALVVVHGTVWF